MTSTAEPDARAAEAALPDASPDPVPDEGERQRLRFELELLALQDAGAALDPLLRPPRPGEPL